MGPQVAMQMMYAPWATRVLGYLIDSLLVGAVMGVLYLILGTLLVGIAGSTGSENAAGGLCCIMLVLFPLSALLVGFFNRVYLVATRGYSIGQGVVKVKVVDGAGNLLTTGTAFIRLLAQIGMGLVPLLSLVDLLWPLWDERRQTLHDKAVGCFVINNG
ncbi:MAG TPA: RDD family protein [Verrucomicrobiae bacterium]|nr:RDD family protein [Verrucomicrobiae bacterium]